MWRMGRGLGILVVSLVALAPVPSAALGGGHATTPVQKVVELLQKLRDQVMAQGKDEALGYDKFACFCKEQADNKVYVIKDSQVKIAELEATVNYLGADIALLASDAVALRNQVTIEESQVNVTATARAQTAAAYMTARANLTQGIDAITEAVKALQASRDAADRAAVAARAATVLLETEQLLGALQQPRAYEYRSTDVHQTLQDLKLTFKKQLDALDNDEAGSRNQYEMLAGATARKLQFMQAAIDEKEALSAKKSGEKSTAQDMLNKETTAVTADQAFLDQLTSMCTDKAQAWDRRSKTRAAEITVMTEALGVLEEMGGLYSVNRKLTGFMLKEHRTQPEVKRHLALVTNRSEHGSGSSHVKAKAISLLQLIASRPSGPQQALDFLEQQAAALGSGILAQVAALLQLSKATDANVTGPSDQFASVRGIIKDLIATLEGQATTEATQKSFCDAQMAAGIQSRDQHSSAMESLAASIQLTGSQIQALALTIAEVSEEIAALNKALSEMTQLRSEEKARNQRTVSEADAGAAAVQQAIVLLQNFYGNTSMFVEGYDGGKAESKGIIGLLQVIQSDFQRTSSTTAAAEQAEDTAFQTQTAATQASIDEKKLILNQDEASQQSKEADLTTFQDSLKQETDLHASAVATLETLQASCVDASESWEERKANRAKEVEALKQALQILEDWQG